MPFAQILHIFGTYICAIISQISYKYSKIIIYCVKIFCLSCKHSQNLVKGDRKLKFTTLLMSPKQTNDNNIRLRRVTSGFKGNIKMYMKVKPPP